MQKGSSLNWTANRQTSTFVRRHSWRWNKTDVNGKNSSVQEKSFYELTYTNERLNRNKNTLCGNSHLFCSVSFFLRFSPSIFWAGICFSFQHFSIFFEAYAFSASTSTLASAPPVSYVQLISIRLMTNHTFADHINEMKLECIFEKKGFDGEKKMNGKKADAFFLSNLLSFLFVLMIYRVAHWLNYVWVLSFFSRLPWMPTNTPNIQPVSQSSRCVCVYTFSHFEFF